MASQLNELRDQVARIDREIVDALAVRCRFGAPAPTPKATPPTTGADPLTARVESEYVHMLTEQMPCQTGATTDASACAAADRTLTAAVRRRLGVALEIARAKEASQTPQFRALVAARDAKGLEQAITQPAVEEQVIARVRTAARERFAEGLPVRFADTVTAIYRDWIIPLSRRVQVERLLGDR